MDILFLQVTILQRLFIYLQNKSQTMKHVKYEHPMCDEPVLISIEEVFATNIAVDSNLVMDIGEYQSILSSAL